MGQARECLGQGPSSCSLVPPGLQEQVTAAVAHAVEQQMQKLLEETQLDMNEFDNLLQPIIDTCTKDAISVRVGGGLVGADPRLRGSFGARLGSGQYTGKVRRSTGAHCGQRTVARGACNLLTVSLAVAGREKLDVQQCQVPATLRADGRSPAESHHCRRGTL